MTTPTVAITLTGSPTTSQPPSPTSTGSRPSLGARSASWSVFADYSLAARRPSVSDTLSEPGDPDTTLEALTAPDGSLTRLSCNTRSRDVSPKQSMDAGYRPPPSPSPSPRQGAVTPLTAMDKVFDVPASEGLADRLKELARQTNTSVLEVLRRLSEAERQSSLVKSASSKDELRDYFRTFVTMSEVGLEACFQLDLPLATWEHVAEQLQMEDRQQGIRPQADMATALYWRARHRQERMNHYRTTGRTSG